MNGHSEGSTRVTGNGYVDSVKNEYLQMVSFNQKTTKNNTSIIPEKPEVSLLLQTTEQTQFKSSVGAVLSCLGSAVGTGNIWRFPRILASQSYDKGALTFYLVWAMLLFFWSVPVTLVEYAVGRFARNSVPVAFGKFFGKYFIWVGGWIVVAVFFLGAYYPVIIGWCLYYLFQSCYLGELPATEASGQELFNHFTRETYWPVLCQLLAILLTGVFCFGGIQRIEKANLVLVPLLLVILIFTFGWSLTREYADVAVVFLFTPTWKSLREPSLWIAAAGQNAFDTSAGASSLMTYATFMGRSASITRYSYCIPAMNNLVSLYASITLFCTVFSTLIYTDPTITRSAIVRIMQNTGPGSTGLTFTWIPVLFANLGIFGRILCVLFFICLTVAGISSLLSFMQVHILVFRDIGVPQKSAVCITLGLFFLAGLPSALFLEVLENQDNTWGYALIVSGLLWSVMVLVYGPFRFRRVLINDFNTSDWKVSILWVPLIAVLVPIQGMTLIVWWIYDYIKSDAHWYHITLTSLTTTLLEWFLILIFVVIINLIAVCWKGELFVESRKIGCDPYDSRTYVLDETIDPDEMYYEGVRIIRRSSKSGSKKDKSRIED